MENSGAVGFEKVKVFAADPWYKAQPGSIKNIEINVKGNMNIIMDKKQSFWHRPNHLSLLLPNLGKLIFCQKQKKLIGGCRDHLLCLTNQKHISKLFVWSWTVVSRRDTRYPAGR